MFKALLALMLVLGAGMVASTSAPEHDPVPTCFPCPDNR